jgi:hypothetical protein
MTVGRLNKSRCVLDSDLVSPWFALSIVARVASLVGKEKGRFDLGRAPLDWFAVNLNGVFVGCVNIAYPDFADLGYRGPLRLSKTCVLVTRVGLERRS